jgi:antitoxin component YwqK of YwqJK toxin-antitoxin module
MIKKIVLLAAFLYGHMLLCQNLDPIYYNKDWEVTTKDKASFYRLMPLKQIGELVLLQDFYINGTPQFEGYVLKSNEDAYIGDVVWYDEEGNDSNFRQYRNDTKNFTLLYYHPNGKIRKRVQYKNGVKDGETEIFDENGKLLMKGRYTEGKPASGDFEKIEDNYEYNPSDNEGTVQVVPVEAPPMIDAESLKTPQKKDKKTIIQKIFWKDSYHVAQEKVYQISPYSFKLIGQKNYDKSGKLIQSLQGNHFEEYGSSIANGTEYQYYLSNNFATGIKAVSSFINTLKSGKEMMYFPNGKISVESNYSMGLKEGEETLFSENGSVKNKRVYKEGDPFDGNFEESIGDVSVSLNYINGVKEGEAVAKDEQGLTVAKGIYKNGKPYNGTFVVEAGDNLAELISVENFRKKGLQKVFSYRLENVEKTYTVQNEKLNGTTVFYEDGKAVPTLEYKDDQPYHGTLIENEKTSVYKDGKITEETFFQDHYNKDRIQKQKFYENGILAKIKDFSYTISEKPQEFYEGVLKNGNPFSGYFETEYNREFKQVDYFENGILKFQYSNDYLKNMDNYAHQVYNIKSTYKDGKIFDGVEYNLGEKQFISRYWKNGVLQSFDWDLFAVNYFNRLHFELKNNTIEITDMQANRKAEIKIDQSKNDFNKQLFIDGKLIDSNRKEYLNSKYKEGLVFYREQDGKIIETKVELADESIEPSEGTELFYKVYMMVKESSSVQEIFKGLSEKFVSNKFKEETDENEIITGHQTDAEGKPKDGVVITPTQNNTYTLQFYMNRKLIKTVEEVGFSKLKDELKKLENRD